MSGNGGGKRVKRKLSKSKWYKGIKSKGPGSRSPRRLSGGGGRQTFKEKKEGEKILTPGTVQAHNPWDQGTSPLQRRTAGKNEDKKSNYH